MRPTVLYHVSTPKLAKKYRATGYICKPVRGFTTPAAAMAWAMKTGRSIIYELNVAEIPTHKLPDHHNQFGEAWWIDADLPVARLRCLYSSTGPVEL